VTGERGVAIVGMACVFPEARDLRAYWRNIVNGVDAIRPLPDDRWPGHRGTGLPAEHFAHIPCRRGGFVPTPLLFDPLRLRVPPALAAQGDVDQFVLLQILADALDDAGIGPAHPARRRADVIVGRGGYTSNKMMEIFLRADLIDRLCVLIERRFPQLPAAGIDALAAELQQGLGPLDVEGMASSIPNLVASRAANRLDLRGAAWCVDAACASSLIAVEQAVQRLREGRADLVLACGINFTQIPSFWYLFSRILAVSPSGCIRPFDRRADGLLIGEGAGAVALKRLEDARRDGDRVHAVILGAGSAGDGGAVGVLAPSFEGQLRALAAAYDDAGADPRSIGLLEAHGTGTEQGDAAEIRSIIEFFGPRATRWPTRVLGSVKSMIGHTMPAAGIASLIKAAMALRSKVLPPSLHCEQPHPDLDEAPFYVNQEVRPWTHAPASTARRAGVSAFGFGGVNSHVVLEEAAAGAARVTVPARPPRPEVARPSELLVFTAAAPRDLAALLRRAARFVAEDEAGATLEDLAWTLAGEIVPDAPCTLALVAEDLADLPARLADLAGALERGDGPPRADGLFYAAARKAPGRVAALFPGLAFPGLVGHYPQHLMTLCLHFPSFREKLDLAEARDAHPEDPLPTSFLMQPPLHLGEEERARLRQRFAIAPLSDDPQAQRPPAPDERLLSAMGTLVANGAGWALLARFGIPFEMVCGQSLGEISALCAAGVLEFDAMIPRLWSFLSVDPRIYGLGSMAFIGASEEQARPVLSGLSDIHVALYLSRETLIVGGPDEQIDAAVAAFRERQVIAQRLPFPPVHTPLLAARQRELAALDTDPLPLAPPRLAVYSNITAEPMPTDDGQVRELIASNMSRPARFWQTLRRMYDDGARCFIQVGTGPLAGNIRTILPEPDAISVALDVDYRHPLTQLQHLCGTLLTAGVPVDPRALFEAREPAELPLDRPRPQAAPARGAVALSFYRPPIRPDAPAAEPVGSSARDGLVRSAFAAGPTLPAASIGLEAGNRPGSRSGAVRKSDPPQAQIERDHPAPAPFVGRILEHEPGRRVVQVRRFALDEDLYLADHAFLTCGELKPLRERYPVVPLTVTLELLAETAACLAPGLVLCSIEDVRARRWIALDDVDELDVRVEAEAAPADGEGTVVVRATALDQEAAVASAALRFAPRHRLTLDLSFSAWTGSRRFPIPVARLYADRHFFHGPRFHCLTSIDARADQGLSGELVVPPRQDLLRSTPRPELIIDPVVLDGVGQLLGAMFFDRQVDILPVGVDRIEFYRPAPPPGTRVPARLEVVDFDFDERRVVAIAEVQDGAGGVWFRVAGWRDLLFRYTKRLQLVRRAPAQHLLAQEQAPPGLPAGAVACVLPRTELRDARPDNLARLYLTRAEFDVFRSLGSHEARQREWLMGRVAVKDAARLWLARRTGDPMLHPLQVRVDNDAAGRPSVRVEGATAPAVSLSHTARAASAIAAEGPVGIDVEPEEGGRDLNLEDFATDDEIRRVREVAGADDAGWSTRLWCGKEAAAKALGTGLGGRPKALEAVRVEPDGSLIVRSAGTEATLRVATWCVDGLMLAVASPTDAAAIGR